jgi:sulfate adenylyltransferase subunit 2
MSTTLATPRTLSHLDWLESEAIHILREVAGQTTHPALLFSGGKDSIVLLHLATKAFRPARFPFPLMHIDTGHNFPEVIEFRDRRAAELGERLIVRSVEQSMAAGRVVLRSPDESRNKHQSVTLLDAIAEFGFDACIGGARRDEEKARAKERVFSHRDGWGTSTTRAWRRANTCACSRSATGPNWTYGSTSRASGWKCRACISRTSARSSAGRGRWCR